MPTKYSASERNNSLHYPLDVDYENMEEEILKPFTYITAIPGKQIRMNILKVLGHWTTVPADKAAKIEKLLHLIHNGSLLFFYDRLDDIQDHSDLRRGRPTAHKVYGITRTILAFDWLLGDCSQLLNELGNAELTKTYLHTLEKVVAGQGMDLYWRDNYICPTEAEYLQMIYRKTGLVFSLAQMAMNTFNTGKQVDISKFLTAFGVYFQINDDYQNLHNQTYFNSKGFCEDITEGKFSYPIIHAINNFPEEGKQLKQILRERTYDVKLKKTCISILEKCGSFEYTRKKLIELQTVMYEEIAKQDENPLIDEFIKNILTFSL